MKIDVEKLAREAAQTHPEYAGDPMTDDDRACLEHFVRLVMEECVKVCLEAPVLSTLGGHAWTTIKVQEALAEAIRARMPS